MAFLIAMMMAISMSQDNLVPYNDYYHQNTQDGKWKNGTYFVLVAAEWCSPCKMLKQRLAAEYSDIKFGVVDLDNDAVAKILMSYGDGKVPFLLRYDIIDNNVNMRKWDRKEDLKIFMSNVIK